MLKLGFYCGLAILYPYDPVYCDKQDCLGRCVGTVMYQAASAPLPRSYTWCKGADPDKINSWYQWRPRTLDPHRADLLNTDRVCFWEDRGPPRDINDLAREN